MGMECVYATGLRRPICLQANWRFVFAQLEGHLKFGNFDIPDWQRHARCAESVGFSMSSASMDVSLS
jgi:hypothetical protein